MHGLADDAQINIIVPQRDTTRNCKNERDEWTLNFDVSVCVCCVKVKLWNLLENTKAMNIVGKSGPRVIHDKREKINF